MKLSSENISHIKNWTREAESLKWDDFFSHVLNHNDALKQVCKQVCLEFPYNCQFEVSVDAYLKNSISWVITRPLRMLHWNAVYYKNRIASKLASAFKH